MLIDCFIIIIIIIGVTATGNIGNHFKSFIQIDDHRTNRKIIWTL